MEYLIRDSYPGDAAHGGCYLSRAAQGEVVVNGQPRRERVIVTPIHIDFEGQLCIGERAARHMAHLLGMVDDWRVAGVVAELGDTRDERDRLSAEVQRLRDEVELLRQLDSPEEREVFVALDGTRHASAGAAQSASERAVGKMPDVLARVQRISAVEAPNPSIQEAV